jgi:hypothetical protein
MRYLKMTAHDDYDNDVIDTVYLEFFDGVQAKAVAEALAMNTPEQDHASLRWLMGEVIADDIDGNGVVNSVDGELARALARRFLKFGWWRMDRPFNRYLEIVAEDLDLDGQPDLVRLRFHEGDGPPTDDTLVDAAACIFLNDSAGNCFTLNEDVNAGSYIDQRGATFVEAFCRDFLRCNWNNVRAAKPCSFSGTPF